MSIRQGKFFVHEFGNNPAVDGEEDIWENGGAYEFPLVAFETEIVGLPNDMVTSDGAHSVEINGLDADYNEITEVATLTGATPVTLANSFFRINNAHVEVCGASNVNSGNIAISHTGSATIGLIGPLHGQAMQALYTVPANVSGHVIDWHFNMARRAEKTGAECEVQFQTRKENSAWTVRGLIEAEDGFNYVRKYETNVGLPLAERTDIRVRVTAVSTDNLSCTTGYEISCFRNLR